MTKIYRQQLVKAIKELDKNGLESGMPQNMKYRDRISKARKIIWKQLDKAGWTFNTDYKLYQK